MEAERVQGEMRAWVWGEGRRSAFIIAVGGGGWMG